MDLYEASVEILKMAKHEVKQETLLDSSIDEAAEKELVFSYLQRHFEAVEVVMEMEKDAPPKGPKDRIKKLAGKNVGSMYRRSQSGNT